MAVKKGITLSRSLYSKRTLHQTLDGRNSASIYETDYTTLRRQVKPEIDKGAFDIVFDTSADVSRKYSSGEWVKPSIGDGNDFWVYGETVESGVPSEGDALTAVNSEMVLRPDTSSLSSFVSFGSAVEFIRTSIENIVNTFPASLWIRPPQTSPQIVYELSNPFGIDLETQASEDMTDNIRIMSRKYASYEFVRTDCVSNSYLSPCGDTAYNGNVLSSTVYPVTGFEQTYWYVYVKRTTGKPSDAAYRRETSRIATPAGYYDPIRLINTVRFACSSFAVTVTYVYNDANGEPCLLLRTECAFSNGATSTGTSALTATPSWHIRPRQTFTDAFFASLDDFSAALLDRNTNPPFTYTLSIPKEVDGILSWQDERFTWRTPDGWNLDIESAGYVSFMEKMIEAANIADSFVSDTVYRLLTHDSLKNMDFTEDGAEDYADGSTRFEKMIRLCGYGYDIIRKYVHGIEVINNLSYNRMDNMPDVLLKEHVAEQGWQPVSLVMSGGLSQAAPKQYYGTSQPVTGRETEVEFYRRFLLNSAHIHRWKGTKHGLEMVMNLFGIERNDWEIGEFVYVATHSRFFSDNTSLFQDEVAVTSIGEGYVYRVKGSASPSAYVTYNGDRYYNGNSFTGVSGFASFSTAGGASVYMDELENLAWINSMRGYTMEGIEYLSSGMALENDEEPPDDDLHDLAVERFYYGDFLTCPACGTYSASTNTGGGVLFINGVKSICPRCNGTGVVRDCIGIPAFKGNSEILYYQQDGGWYRETYGSILEAPTLDDLYSLNGTELSRGVLYYVSNSNVSTDSTHYWVLVDPDFFNSREGWYNVTSSEYSSSINSKSAVNIPSSSPVTQINFYALEHVSDLREGNNPHMGEGAYDGGMSYLRNIGYSVGGVSSDSYGLFKYVIDSSVDCIKTSAQYLNMIRKGFVLVKTSDTKKCWGIYSPSDNKLSFGGYNGLPCLKEKGFGTGRGNCNTYRRENGQQTRKYSYAGTPEYYRVVNTKNILLTYRAGTQEKINEFYSTVLPVLEDVIPSTAIVSLDIKTA
jgi:hypothetical protein